MIKNLNLTFKKGFTLFEILLTLIALSGIFYLYFNEKQKTDFYNSMNNFIDKVNLIVKKAVIDPINGYINEKGGYCSENTSYYGLTAGRAIKCIGWNTKIFPVSEASVDATISSPSNEYIYGLFRNNTKNDGCKIYLKPDGTDLTIFYLFIDCSNLNYSKDNRGKKLLESKLIYSIKNNFPNTLQEIYPKAIDIDTVETVNSGKDNDGKIGFKFKN